MTTKAVTYDQCGVNYTDFDDFKIACQQAGMRTAGNLKGTGFKELRWSRGESAYVMKTPWPGMFLACVEEGLGTKDICADETAKAIREAAARLELAHNMMKLLGKSFFWEVAQCNVAMVINDLITVGAKPLAFMLHLAVGHADWFKNQKRAEDLIEGTRIACQIAQCAWGGGETPVLRNIVLPDAALLSGSANGIIMGRERLINPANIEDGDAIVMFESSGIGANGLTMMWNTIAPRLPNGYLTVIPGDGRTFGQAVLAPTIIYSRLIQAILNAGVPIHYAVNITGHGWRKLMRAVQPFVYIISRLPRQQPLFEFIQTWNPISNEEMYGTFNMGAGFAIYVPEKNVETVIRTANRLRAQGHPFYAFRAGHIEKSVTRRVEILPPNITFEEESLKIR